MRYTEAFKYTAKQVLWQAPTDPYLYSELYSHTKDFLWALLAFIVCIVMLLLAPISIPLLAYGVKKDEELREKPRKKFIKL